MYGIAGVIRLAAANLQALEFVGILPQHLRDRVTDSGVPHDRTVVLDVRRGRHVLDAAALLDYLVDRRSTTQV